MIKKYFSLYYSFLFVNQLIILSISGILGERIPDATEIDQYDDPLLDEIFKETNSDIQKIENVASPINQPSTTQQQNSLQQTQQINSEYLSSSQSSLHGINPNIKPPAGSLFPTEIVKHQQNNFGRFPQNPYEGGGLTNIALTIIFLPELLLLILLIKPDRHFIQV
uniref:Uncharacterized protein n=1 Tax=Meloidogyne enterolobii TaxID=390850 RepID=A0A6V7V2I8_MELEN|nr:unnamed protein product [Meloidogyne enterolobii]CAD2170422.1 unnamed protein product [Meloidogyne enterolobii]